MTRYELQPNAGVKISRITGLADDIALRLAATGVRIEAPIPGKAAVGIEVPNKVVRPGLSAGAGRFPGILARAKSRLTVALGRDISGPVSCWRIWRRCPICSSRAPPVPGKSVCTNSMIQSVPVPGHPAMTCACCSSIPSRWNSASTTVSPTCWCRWLPIPARRPGALGWAVTEMLNRYKTFAENNVRDLESYNELARRSDTLKPMPLILIVIDELADLMMAAASEVEDAIIRLAQMARAAGMHLVIATQRPSVDVITGLIKANIPSRLALTVASAGGFAAPSWTPAARKSCWARAICSSCRWAVPKPMRVQGCFVSNREVESVVDFLKASRTAEYDEDVMQEIERQAEN